MFVLTAGSAHKVLVGDPALDAASALSAPSSPSVTDAFHWLDPIAPSSGTTANLDASLLSFLTVEVCEVSNAGCVTVRSFTSTSVGPDQLRIEKVGKVGGYYIVNWDTQKAKISLTKTYRIIVSMPGIDLGRIDLTPSEYKTFGRTWPIKFLVENNPAVRVRLLRYLGKSASQIADVLRREFGLTQDEVTDLLVRDVDPFTDAEIQIAIDGVFQKVVIPSTTKIIDEATAQALSSFDPATGTMFFSSGTALLTGLKNGDVLVSAPGPNAPYGYLRMVSSIRRDKGVTYLETTQAKITDAVYEGHLRASGELLPPPPGSTLAAANSLSFSSLGLAPALNQGDSYNFREDVDVSIDLATAPGDVEGTGTVRVQGYVNFNAGYDLGMGIESCLEVPPVCVDRVEAWMEVEQQSHIKITGDFDGRLNKEQTLDTIRFTPIVVMIGPVPVVIVPVVNVVLGVDGNAHVDFTFEAGSTTVVKAGAKWTDPDDNGQGWENISESNLLNDDDFVNADIFGQVFLEGYGKVKGQLLLYGVFGPAVDASLGVSGFGQSSGTPLWKISGHITTGVSVGADAAGFFGLGTLWDEDILSLYFDIREAGNFPPVFSNVRTERIPVEIGTPVYLGPRSPGSLQGYYEVKDPEGADLMSLTITDQSGQLIDDTFTFTSPGLRTIKVTATDITGASASIFLGIDVRNAVPLLTVTPSTGEVAAGDQFFLTAVAYDPEDGFLPCSSLSWTATPEATVQRSSNPNVCAVVVVFAQQGPGRVTVTATDSIGEAFAQSVDVAVGPVPANRKPVIDLDSFKVSAFRGPRTAECPLGLGCEVPNDALLSNGEPGSGDYDPPLYMAMNVTDPEGDPIFIQWFCQTGDQFASITYLDDGTASCEPIYSPNETIRVYAAIMSPPDINSDSWTVLGYSPEYHFAMLQRTA